MGIIETAKEVASLVQKADNIELYQRILELQTQIMEVLEQNHQLKLQSRELSERLNFRESLVFRDNMYWRRDGDGKDDGPFCSTCWDGANKAVRLQTLNGGRLFCSVCKRGVPGSGDVVEPPDDHPRGNNWVNRWRE